MSEPTLKEKTARGLFWGGLSNGVQQILVLIFGVFLARTLNADDYGLVGMLAIFSAIAGTIINSGFTIALINKRDATHKDYNAVFWFTVFVGLICYAILFFCAPIIAQFYERPELTTLSRVVFLCFFFSGAGAVSQTVLFKQLKVKQQAQIDIASMALSGVVGVSLAINGYAYWALALQSLTYIGGGTILRFIFSPWKPTLEFDFIPLKGMLSFSIKLFLTNIFQQISNNIFSIVIGKFYNATQLGYYSQGQKWMLMGHTLIGGMINSVSQPILVESRDSMERQQNIFHKLLRFGAFVSFPLMLGLAFVGEEFIVIAIGDKWLPAVFFLRMFCLLGSVGFMSTLYTMLLITHGKSNVYMSVAVYSGILQLLSVLLTFNLGIHIMVSVYIFSHFISILIWQYYAKKIACINFIDVLKDIIPYLGITVISFLIAYIATLSVENIYVLFALKVLVSAFFYIALSWIGKSTLLKESVEFIRRYKF